MAHYSIYIPGAKGATNDHLGRVGLAALHADMSPGWTEVIGRGPDGGTGSIATWSPTGRAEYDPIAGYYPDRQKWSPSTEDTEQKLAAGRYWIGVEPARPVSPTDLERKRMVAGDVASLADSQLWCVPYMSRVPCAHRLRGGKWTRVVHHDYEEFHRRGAQLLQSIFEALDLQDFLEGRVSGDQLSDTPQRISIADGGDFCCIALGINYRLTPEIIDHLQLLDDASMVRIIHTVIEMQAILDVREQKKSAEYVDIPVTSTISNGV